VLQGEIPAGEREELDDLEIAEAHEVAGASSRPISICSDSHGSVAACQNSAISSWPT
jgi:hypothetical protein